MQRKHAVKLCGGAFTDGKARKGICIHRHADRCGWISISFKKQATHAVIAQINFGEQGVAVFRVFINEASIFGILMTLIARAVVELLWWGVARLWRTVNPPEPEATLQTKESGNYYS